jgi:hypothetical protein
MAITSVEYLAFCLAHFKDLLEDSYNYFYSLRKSMGFDGR